MGRLRKGNKWRPGDALPDGPWEFTDDGWAAVKSCLPAGAPRGARPFLEMHVAALWNKRMIRAASTREQEALKSLTKSLRDAVNHARVAARPEWEATLAGFAQEAEEASAAAWGRSVAYARQSDPDREEFLFAVLRDYRKWGGDLGNGQYVPKDLKRFLTAVSTGAAEPLQPASIGKVMRRFRSRNIDL